MALCDFCVTNVLRSTESWGMHQESYAELAQSAREGCIFCKRLCDDVQRFQGEAAIVPHDESWPLYRWSVRTLARFRETSVCVRITFRPIASEDDSTGTDPPGPLAQRTFCLFPEDGAIDLETDKDTVKTAAEQVHRWMRTCNSPEHESCHFDASPTPGINDQPFLPTRLLDVGGDSRGPFRVVETKGSGIKGPYATLSHRWAPGMVAAITTAETKRAYFDEGVPWDELGLKFQQAVDMARYIGVSYIWIDSLCIIQDNVDFRKEGGLMHKVYRHSFCNIALECSEAGKMSTWTGEGGLLWQPYHRLHGWVEDKPPGGRKMEDYELVKYAADGSSPLFGNKTWRITPSDLWERGLLQANIYSRGWIFQERMLSPRILHLTHTQMFWDCPSMSASETFPKGLPQSLDNDARYDRHWRGRLQDPGNLGVDVGPNDNEPIQDFWQEAVKKYTRCELTNRDDKLLAIWSVAKVVRDVLNSELDIPSTQYCAGLWDNGLAEQLAWRLADGPLKKAIENQQGFPSWSWASLDGPINVPDRYRGRHAASCQSLLPDHPIKAAPPALWL